MKKAAIIEDGKVINVILTDDDDFAVSIGAIPCSNDVEIGWRLVGGKLLPPVPTASDLDAVKADLKWAVDTNAEKERGRYLTAGSGQAMTYQAKAAEAIRYDATGGVGEYPFLSCEVGITGATLEDVAAVVLDMHNQWQAIGGEIERVRLLAKAQIDLAQDEAIARAVVPVWPVL